MRWENGNGVILSNKIYCSISILSTLNIYVEIWKTDQRKNKQTKLRKAVLEATNSNQILSSHFLLPWRQISFSTADRCETKAKQMCFQNSSGGNKAEITWIDECKREVAQKIDQANDRQTEKKGLAERHGRCLGARLASAGELNTRLDAHCICLRTRIAKSFPTSTLNHMVLVLLDPSQIVLIQLVPMWNVHNSINPHLKCLPFNFSPIRLANI